MKNYDIIFLSELAIGNTLEMLYAVEYCLNIDIKVGIYIRNPNKSFIEYLCQCYGKEVILYELDNISVTNLIHTFIVSKKVDILYENYLYINPDKNSTQYQSETEQYISMVKALYPSSYHSNILTMLIEEKSQRVNQLEINNKYVIYAGCSSFASVRRWPHYMELIKKLGKENVVVVGGVDDLNNEYAYKYKNIVSSIFSYHFTNRKSFWNVCKKLYLLEPYAHNREISILECSYFNVFEWGELVSIFRHCKGFIGNDGGLMHLASCSGAKGIAIFGPTSVNKSRSYNPNIKEVFSNYECQPCFFEVGQIINRNYCISCPYSIKCLTSISADTILQMIKV